MSGWPTIELGQLAEFRNGLNYSAADNGAGLAVVGVSDFQDKSFVDFSGLAELDPSVLSTPDALIRKNDIIFVRSNGNRNLIGRSLLVLIDPPMRTSHSGFTIRLRFTDKRANPRFFAYLLRGGTIRRHLSSQGGGTSINNLNQGILSRLTVPLPSLETQRRIASILGAYDDLIEVNRRRIAVLEKMGRGLFEEWFVRFRFPGHEAVPILDTPDGPLPEGWSWTPLAKLAKFKSGNNKLTKAAYREDGVIAYSASGPDGFVEQAEGHGPAVIVGAVGAYCGKSWLADGEWTAIANTFALLPCQGVPAEFLFLAMYGIEKWPRRGAAQPFIAKADAGAKTLPHPPQEIWTLFARHVGPIFNLITALGTSNSNLAASRNLILPRLISGQLSVAEAERVLEAAA